MKRSKKQDVSCFGTVSKLASYMTSNWRVCILAMEISHSLKIAAKVSFYKHLAILPLQQRPWQIEFGVNNDNGATASQKRFVLGACRNDYDSNWKTVTNY